MPKTAHDLKKIRVMCKVCGDGYTPEKIRMVSIPLLKLLASALGGLGVVGREGMGVADRETTPLSLVSLDSTEDRSVREQGPEAQTRTFGTAQFEDRT